MRLFRGHSRRVRPQLLVLEDRLTPADFAVTSELDVGVGSLREAVALAEANPGDDRVVIDPVGL